MEYYGNNDFRDYHLAHYGVVGMHWGIRRYQPYSVAPRGSGKRGKEIGLAGRISGGLSEGVRAIKRHRAERRIEKTRKANLKKAREAREAKKAQETEKQRILRSGSAEELLKNKDLFNNDEVRTAIERIGLQQSVEKLKNEQNQIKLDKAEQLNTLLKTITGYGQTALDLYDKGKKIHNAVNEMRGLPSLEERNKMAAEERKKAASAAEQAKKEAIQSGDLEKIKRYEGKLSSAEQEEFIKVYTKAKQIKELANPTSNNNNNPSSNDNRQVDDLLNSSRNGDSNSSGNDSKPFTKDDMSDSFKNFVKKTSPAYTPEGEERRKSPAERGVTSEDSSFRVPKSNKEPSNASPNPTINGEERRRSPAERGIVGNPKMGNTTKRQFNEADAMRAIGDLYRSKPVSEIRSSGPSKATQQVLDSFKTRKTSDISSGNQNRSSSSTTSNPWIEYANRSVEALRKTEMGSKSVSEVKTSGPSKATQQVLDSFKNRKASSYTSSSTPKLTLDPDVHGSTSASAKAWTDAAKSSTASAEKASAAIKAGEEITTRLLNGNASKLGGSVTGSSTSSSPVSNRKDTNNYRKSHGLPMKRKIRHDDSFGVEYYGANDWRNYLSHHGVVGMHWGIRRYQPYGEGGYNRIGGKTGKEVGEARKSGNDGRRTGALSERERERERKRRIAKKNAKEQAKQFIKDNNIMTMDGYEWGSGTKRQNEAADLALKTLRLLGRYDKDEGDRDAVMLEEPGYAIAADLVNQGKTKDEIIKVYDKARRDVDENLYLVVEDPYLDLNRSEAPRGFIDACIKVKNGVVKSDTKTKPSLSSEERDEMTKLREHIQKESKAITELNAAAREYYDQDSSGPNGDDMLDDAQNRFKSLKDSAKRYKELSGKDSSSDDSVLKDNRYAQLFDDSSDNRSKIKKKY